MGRVASSPGNAAMENFFALLEQEYAQPSSLGPELRLAMIA